VLTSAPRPPSAPAWRGIRFAITSGRPPRAWPCCSMNAAARPRRSRASTAGCSSSGSLDHRTEDAAGRCRRQGDRADPRARSRCLGLSRQRLADHQGRRPARRARGLDGQVPAEGGGGFHRTRWRRGQDRRHQRRPRQGQRCEADAQAAFGERATASRSQPYYLDVTHKDANKGAVVAYLSPTWAFRPRRSPPSAISRTTC
jgi:hypothetical protein